LSMVIGRANQRKLTIHLRSFPFVQVFSRRQFRKLFEVFRAQWIGNGVFFAKPFAEVNQLATARTKRAVGTGEPIPHPLACGTFYIHCTQR
jgi:hypothetical protein